jgi:hypothetical protein
MRAALLFMLFCWLGFFPQQSEIWQHVNAKPGSVQLQSETPSPGRLALLRKALAARVRSDNWPCVTGDEPDWAEKVTFTQLPVSTTEEVVLVEAGMGCARGGQGANGAMWVLQFKHGKPFSLLLQRRSSTDGFIQLRPQPVTGFEIWSLGGTLAPE